MAIGPVMNLIEVITGDNPLFTCSDREELMRFNSAEGYLLTKFVNGQLGAENVPWFHSCMRSPSTRTPPKIQGYRLKM